MKTYLYIITKKGADGNVAEIAVGTIKAVNKKTARDNLRLFGYVTQRAEVGSCKIIEVQKDLHHCVLSIV